MVERNEEDAGARYLGRETIISVRIRNTIKWLTPIIRIDMERKTEKGMMPTQPHPRKEVTKNVETY